MIRRSTWVILGIFILLIAATLVWQRYGEEAEAEVTPTSEQDLLLEFSSEVTGLRIEGVGSQIVEVVREGQGPWKLIEPEGQETDTDSVEAAVPQLSDLRVLSTFEQGLDLGGTGLVVPSYKITISTEDGQKINVNVGKATTTGSGYYVHLGEKGVYVVSKYSLDSILNLLTNPPIMPTSTPQLETEILPAETISPPASTTVPGSTPSP